MKIPNYFEIIVICITRMLSNYDKKGDSWVSCNEDYLISEIKRNIDKLNSCYVNDACINIINLSSMVLHRRMKLK